MDNKRQVRQAFNELSSPTLTLKQRDNAIKQLYLSGKYTTEYIAKLYSITPRTIQRIARRDGYVRTQAESNILIAPLKNYRTVPIELRARRKQLSLKTRYLLIEDHPYCSRCGSKPNDGVRLEIDHIDENATNNDLTNLQVLCNRCNLGKSHLARFN